MTPDPADLAVARTRAVAVIAAGWDYWKDPTTESVLTHEVALLCDLEQGAVAHVLATIAVGAAQAFASARPESSREEFIAKLLPDLD